MKTRLMTNGINCIIPIVLSIIYFFSIKLNLPTIYFVVAGILAAFYMFPIYTFWGVKRQSDGTRERVEYILSCCVCFTIVALSIVYMLLPESTLLKISVQLVCVINVLMVFYFLVRENNERALLQFCYSILVSGVLVI